MTTPNVTYSFALFLVRRSVSRRHCFSASLMMVVACFSSIATGQSCRIFRRYMVHTLRQHTHAYFIMYYVGSVIFFIYLFNCFFIIIYNTTKRSQFTSEFRNPTSVLVVSRRVQDKHIYVVYNLLRFHASE